MSEEITSPRSGQSAERRPGGGEPEAHSDEASGGAVALKRLRYELFALVVMIPVGTVAGFVAYHLGLKLGGAAILGLIAGGFSRKFLPGPGPRSKSTSDPQPTDSFREVIETVVFVVVLVFLLKSFVTEAFVIPTGSMAETLWGYQKIVTCPKCGFSYPVNVSNEVDPQEARQDGRRGSVSYITGCTCPNCMFPTKIVPCTVEGGLFGFFGTVHWGTPTDPRGPPNGIDEVGPTWNSGDRVVVAKFLYDLFDRSPDRLDVVVFKFPGDGNDGRWPVSGPFKNQTAMNYIKRLVGLPGETIVIHEGNLYCLPVDPDAPAPYPTDMAEAKRDGEPPQLWRSPYTHQRTEREARAFFEENRSRLRIIRKPPETMLAMRRTVYDNDHPAVDLQEPKWNRWTGDGWTSDGKRGFRTSGEAGPGTDTAWLHYRHLLRSNEIGGDPRPSLISDFMGYNSWVGNAHNGAPHENWVGDLMLECEAVVSKADGRLVLELSKGVDRFRARFSIAGGKCALTRLREGKEEVLGEAETNLKGPGRYRLRFANFDERLTVWVDNALPFGDGVSYPPPDATGPTQQNDLLEPVSIGSEGAAVAVEKLHLWRDTYYTAGRMVHDISGPQNSDAPDSVRFTDPSTWQPLKDLPVTTLYVQPDHYLCLGDNSPESSDGRAWGLVPKRLLLGRALAVYFPIGRECRIR